jgi:hypothetical protein
MVQGHDAYRDNNYDTVIAYYDKVLAMNNRFVRAYNEKGDVFYKQKNISKLSGNMIKQSK